MARRDEEVTAEVDDAGPAASGAATRTWLFAAALAVTAGVLHHLGVRGWVGPSAPVGLGWWALAPAFLCAEVFVVNLHLRRETHAFTLSELPLVLGLLFATPGALLVGRLVGGGAALVVHARQAPHKAAFNAANFLLESCIALVVYRVVLGDSDPISPAGWAAALAATVAVDLVSALTITAAISLHELELRWRWLIEPVVGGMVAAVTNTSLALVAALLVWHDPRSLVLLLTAVATVLVLYRGYLALFQRYGRLELLYGFTRSTAGSVDEGDVLATVLAEARDLLRAGGAELRLLPWGTEVGVHVTLDDTGAAHPAPWDPDDDAPGSWWRPALGGRAVLLARQERQRTGTEGDGVAAPLQREGRVVGAMVVTDRLGDVATFDADDLMVFETLANHASVALENGRLVGRLRDEVAVRHHEATHDALTGLPNRRLLTQVAPGRLVGGGAVVLIDLDRFKEVNDTLGHAVGDELLREVGDRLAGAAPEGALLAHLGGDEFAILLSGACTSSDALAVAGDLLAALRPPFTVGALLLEVEGTAGVALCPQHGADAPLLLQRAEVAMYGAKGLQGGLQVYAPERDPYSPERLALVADLRAAIDGDGLELHYQPQADLGTGVVHGVEALLRWRHPVRGLLSPGEFLPLAERTGLIRGLTLGVLAEAIAQTAAWHHAGHTFTVSVNLSARNLMDPTLPSEVAAMLRTASLDPRALVLEITESTVMADVGRALAVLRELRDLGVQVAVDDFGTGHSSLAYLQDLPIDELKVDRSFVVASGGRTGDAIVAAVVELGHALGLRIVAEGIEDLVTWERLRDLGCDLGQGYVLARPLPPEQLEVWLHERARAAAASGAPLTTRG